LPCARYHLEQSTKCLAVRRPAAGLTTVPLASPVTAPLAGPAKAAYAGQVIEPPARALPSHRETAAETDSLHQAGHPVGETIPPPTARHVAGRAAPVW